MDNKIKHLTSSQTIPEMEFSPLLRGEAPFYGNLNRSAQSAYDLADTVSMVQSWSGTISILQPADQTHIFKLYEIARIADGEILTAATNSDTNITPIYSRYGIVVAEAEVDSISGLMKNVVVCTFCPNFIFPTTATTPSTGAFGDNLYLNLSDPTNLGATASGTFTRALALKTGTHSIFFSGIANSFGV